MFTAAFGFTSLTTRISVFRPSCLLMIVVGNFTPREILVVGVEASTIRSPKTVLSIQVSTLWIMFLSSMYPLTLYLFCTHEGGDGVGHAEHGLGFDRRVVGHRALEKRERREPDVVLLPPGRGRQNRLILLLFGAALHANHLRPRGGRRRTEVELAAVRFHPDERPVGVRDSGSARCRHCVPAPGVLNRLHAVRAHRLRHGGEDRLRVLRRGGLPLAAAPEPACLLGRKLAGKAADTKHGSTTAKCLVDHK